MIKQRRRAAGSQITRGRTMGLGLMVGFVLAALGPTLGSAQVSQDGSIAGIEARFIDVNGIRTRYYEMGQGEPMVLVHGSGFTGTASANTWYRNLPGLAETFHVYAADKLAYGMTDNPDDGKDRTMAAEVEHMYQFIQIMGLDTVHLVGQSRGGGLAFLLAEKYPEIIRTLVLVDTSTAAPPAGDDRPNRRARIFQSCPEEENAAGDQFRCTQSALAYNPVAVTDEYVATAAYMWNEPKAAEPLGRLTADVPRLTAITPSYTEHGGARSYVVRATPTRVLVT